ncbi:MAG TPA: zf-TFIIB domain-containing protein [Agriterribacter sp.]|nr:zf-TFIIB domain-containing protein [Chitinophagaceae bacterium]HRP31846.1 zf-TFIIB domain-containing protein [Agriterribacter sp.]
MKCPNCNETLLMTQRNNIEIDYCPSCRGVWLDKGELDKMLDYAAQNMVPQQPTPSVPPQYPPSGYYEQKHKYPYPQHGYQKPYKKKGFLGDLFDFD